MSPPLSPATARYVDIAPYLDIALCLRATFGLDINLDARPILLLDLSFAFILAPCPSRRLSIILVLMNMEFPRRRVLLNVRSAVGSPLLSAALPPPAAAAPRGASYVAS